ncbi:hypothetical protein F2Q70_00003058 [Brassica cretica]|uniref:Uncharacterized protein n=1 Tax=Brassica cretica TaxID=69181 RepID=A0A8S9J3J7_BRACR|nr:hypothetical protein F2Q70_00003058 [Brassica cretica]
MEDSPYRQFAFSWSWRRFLEPIPGGLEVRSATVGVVALKSVVQPEPHQTSQTSQTGHLGDTSARRSVQGAYLNNQKEFVYEINFYRRLTNQGFGEAWNFNKIFKDKKVMNFTNWSLSSPSSCEYQPLEVDFSPTMKWPSPEPAMGFKTDVLALARNQPNWSKKNQDAINFSKPTTIWESLQPIRFGSIQSYLWKPGDHLNHPEDIQDVLSCTSTQRIRRILIYLNLLYLESLAITLQQLPKQVVHDFSTYQIHQEDSQEALISTQTVQLVTGKKRRFSIFTRAEQKKISAARKMTTLPDLSALLGSRLGGSSSNEPIVVSGEATRGETLTVSPRSMMVPDPMVSELPKGSLAPEVVEPEKTKKKGKKRAAFGISVSSVEGTSAEAQSDEPSKKKTKKKKKKSVEEQAEPDEGGSNDSPGDPLERKKRKKQSVDHDAPVLTEQDNSHASEERERDRLLAGKKAQKERFLERFGELKDKFRSSRERTAPAADELIASKETSDNAPQLGGKVVTSPGGTQVGEGVLEISDSSSEDRSEGDPVEKKTGSELGDAEKSPGARSKLIETIEATPVDEHTEGISVDHPNSSADVPDGSVPPVANASED